MYTHLVENYLIGVLAYKCIQMKNLEKVSENFFAIVEKKNN